jgi:aminotransferase in exopolysaccharide biosynthesis
MANDLAAMNKNQRITEFIKALYPGLDPVPLHAPVFRGNEKKYLNDCIDTTFVSYVGRYVSRFEEMIASFLGVQHAVAVVNGTVALQVVLQLAGIRPGDEVLTQALTFVASANAIHHAGGSPLFIDSDRSHLGMDPDALEDFLKAHADRRTNGEVFDRVSGRRIGACVPVHVFGHPARIGEIVEICGRWGIPVVEDAAESIGSTWQGRHMGTFGTMGVLSFNGNKTVTTGGGGMIVTNDPGLAGRARHLTTTAKVAHPWEFFHDEAGYNFRLTNVNAAIGCAQMEQIAGFLEQKRRLAGLYGAFFAELGMKFITEPPGCRSNYWLNTIVFDNRAERDAFLKYSNENRVMARPAWTLMNKLPMYASCRSTGLDNAQWLEDRLVNLPSGVPPVRIGDRGGAL